LLTFALRIMLYPLNAWTIKSQMKMQEMGPKMSAIKAKYARDPQRQKLEMVKLYKEKGTNPLLGCFPMFIQLPFLIGMFDLLKSTFELRGAVFIPGWIDNLTAPDVLFTWNYPIPLIGNEFHLLPIIMGAVMFLQSKFTAKATKTSGPMTDQQKQQKMMTSILPIVFTVIFYRMPSGLNIYYLFFSLFGILQQWIMNKQTKKKALLK
nr:Membrane protein insertase YidC [Candidatus Anoxychlamydiales bacterium]